jgi:hypothetical protein
MQPAEAEGRWAMKSLRLAVLAMVVVGAPALAGDAADGGVEQAALVRFHTVCASCHAGECSGRLSFQSGRPGAERHILRYAPSADAKVVRELFVQLTRMKRTCEIELPSLPEPRQAWSEAQLREWNNPDADAWFIPLGELPAGALSLALDPGAQSTGRAQLLDTDLETLSETPLSGKAVELRVELKRPARCFLLVRGAKALRSLVLSVPRGV